MPSICDVDLLTTNLIIENENVCIFGGGAVNWHTEWHCTIATRKDEFSASETQLDTHKNKSVLGCQGYINQIWLISQMCHHIRVIASLMQGICQVAFKNIKGEVQYEVLAV